MTFVSATKRDLRYSIYRVNRLLVEMDVAVQDGAWELASCDAIAIGLLADDLRALADRLAHWHAMGGDVSAFVARERLKNRGAPNST